MKQLHYFPSINTISRVVGQEVDLVPEPQEWEIVREMDDTFQMFWSFGIHTCPESVDGFDSTDELCSSSKAESELVGEINIKEEFFLFVFYWIKSLSTPVPQWGLQAHLTPKQTGSVASGPVDPVSLQFCLKFTLGSLKLPGPETNPLKSSSQTNGNKLPIPSANATFLSCSRHRVLVKLISQSLKLKS